GLRAADDPAGETLAFPHGGGVLLREPRAALRAAAVEGIYPGWWTMQFSAYGAAAAGCLAAAVEDGAGRFKRFRWSHRPGTDTLEWSAIHFPDAPTHRHTVPYAVSLAMLAGNHWHAAAWYRAWATRQVWCSAGPLAQRASPSLATAPGVWLWNRGDAHAVARAARAFRQALGAPVKLQWYWWHAAPYDTGFPDYFPPRGGETAFGEAVQALRNEGILAEVYVNGVFAGERSHRWEADGIARHACKKSDGSLYRYVFNVFNQAPLTPMCPTTGYLQAMLAETVARLSVLGVAGTYLDCVACACPVACYDASHPHQGPYGSFWVDAYRQLIPQVRRAGGPDFTLTTESCAEPYLDLFDAFLVLDVSFDRYAFFRQFAGRWEPIPLFAAVYHDYARIFGASAQPGVRQPYDPLWPPAPTGEPASVVHADYTAYLRYELARLFVWGHQPMVANWEPGLEERAGVRQSLQFLRTLVALRETYRAWLDVGRLRALPETECPWDTLCCLVSWVYQAPGSESVTERPAPAVVAGAWESPEGRRALFLANHTLAPAAFRLTPPPDWGATEWEAQEGIRHPMVAADGTLSGELP
ncbi:MAG: DUF6259 domain-containing protein, partial [Armatimonadota bacterium]|nr:DUF6259 domain-containing protein [Armatimonadota bacterium]